MAYSAELLATTLVHLEPKITDLWTRSTPAFSYFIGKKAGQASGQIPKFKLEGPYMEFMVAKGGPGSMQTFETGDELITAGRRQQHLRGSEFTAYMMYTYNLPGMELSDSGGKMDIGKVVETGPLRSLEDMRQIMNRQLVAGTSFVGTDPVSNGATGLITLNGNAGYSAKGTSRTGILKAATVANQTGSTHGLPEASAASNPTAGWYNQYDAISSFSVDGMRKYRTMIQTINSQGVGLEGEGVDLVLCDQGTYQNMLEALDDKIQLIDKVDYPLARHLTNEGFRLNGVDWYFEPDINLTDTAAFSATQRTGLAYILTSSNWHMFYNEGHKSQVGGAFFDMKDWILLSDMDAYQFRIKCNFNFYCDSKRHQGVLVGGAEE